ncbi:MAG: SGNH/GDSL hydrolase family protein [Planctomycetes bacterium]|nr:SGNH/GDSL hydrolase family protein [Planctomycetota bacterium]
MSHVVLLGDSIFDNEAYVPDRPAVIDQVRRGLPPSWNATLVAVDGHVIEDIERQLKQVPQTATHFVISVGGNNALQASLLLNDPASTVGDALAQLAAEADKFRAVYVEMLRGVLELGKPTCICTIYDAVPVIGPAERAALAGFNDIITRAANLVGLPLIDLRVICNHPDDYSPLSPIEPSVVGGAKIADAICRMLAGHDFTADRCTVWV